jgi:hypothetical protein
MPNVLTKTSVIACGHPPGVADLTGAASKLRVLGQPVVVATDVTKIVGCLNPATCGAVAVTAGLATKLRVGGQPVLLDTLKGTATPSGTLAVVTVQTKLTAR